jgi:hypothetical protein
MKETRITLSKLLMLLAFFLAGAVLGESALDALEKKPNARHVIPKVVSSSDGLVEVIAADVPGDTIGFRLPLLSFTTRNIRSLAKSYNLDIPRGNAGIVIQALNGKTNDSRVITRVYRNYDGQTVTRITLPSPGYSDIEKLTFEIASAYFRCLIDRNSDGKTKPGTMPDWVIQGLIRAINKELSRNDLRFVLELWSNGKLPFFPALCSDLRFAKGPAASLPGHVAYWMKEKHVVKGIIEHLAAGNEWNGKHLAKVLTGVDTPFEQDRIHDERMVKLSRSILSPGEADIWDVKVFSSRLLLNQRIFDKNKSVEEMSCTFKDAVKRVESEDWIRPAARDKALSLPFYAMGRGEELVKASHLYVKFLHLLAEGGEKESLEALLGDADRQMRLAAEKIMQSTEEPSQEKR